MSSLSTDAAGRLADVYRRNRERSRALFDLLADEAYESRPIDLRHPIIFYDGHLPAFSFNTLVKRALGRPSIDPDLEALFARGIDPRSPQATAGATTNDKWPAHSVVRAFTEEADRRVLDALTSEDLERPGDPLLDRAQAAFAILEHELMHQETLLHMWHQLPHTQKRRPVEYVPVIDEPAPSAEWVDVNAGAVTLGVDRDAIEFGWDNESPRHAMHVGAFRIQRLDVTNEQFLEFVDDGGYVERRWWRPEDWMWLQRERITIPTAYSTLRVGIHSRLDLTRLAEAHGGSTTSSAMDGNGPARDSHRSRASGRCVHIRNTPPIFSTASTT
jgi:gamma-glutamyl hercynylcysteine S-oxide synthase